MKKMFSPALKIPMLSWCPKIEPSALKQAINLARLPFAAHHVALMPDSHFGFGMPIGGVLATNGVIIPNAVGKDIGCGMHAVKLDITSIEMDALKQILSKIRELIPVGFKHRQAVDEMYMPSPWGIEMMVVDNEYKSARTQIGTLGGGKRNCLQAKSII